MEDLIRLLTEKDDKEAFANTKQIAFDSEFSDKYYASLDTFASLLTDKKSYIRTRAFILCCSQAKWDKEGKIRDLLPKMFPLLHDEKPTVVRQCLNALQEVATFRPELRMFIENELETIDLSKYKDSMSPLIEKDIISLKKLMEETDAQN